MRSFICTIVMAIAFVGIVLGAWAASVHAVTPDSRTDGLRSAFLGSDVWEDNLSSTEVKHQLQEHFSQVIERLESTNASSLLLALKRAEATTTRPWTKAQRRTALIFLAGNRQRQIARLRFYMNRGLFPQNEGQSETAVPIFVDQHQTHCAVGYLMHRDGKDSEVASIVDTNNLVYVSDVRGGGMVEWIRSSGLTQEEAALIQPAYAAPLDATFEDLSAPMATVQGNGLLLSEATFRGALFNATLPASFQSAPNAIQGILAQGQAAIEASNFDLETERNGVLFGMAGERFGDQYFTTSFPQNLDSSLYVGSDTLNTIFPGVLGLPLSSSNSATATVFNAGIVEIEYLLRSQQNDFSQIALTSGDGFGGPDEQNAAFLLSKIYDGGTDLLLGETQLYSPGSISLSGTDSIQVATDSVRIKTFGLLVDGDDFDDPYFGPGIASFFHEFETSAVPEPGSGLLLMLTGTAAVARRRRRAVSN